LRRPETKIVGRGEIEICRFAAASYLHGAIDAADRDDTQPLSILPLIIRFNLDDKMAAYPRPSAVFSQYRWRAPYQRPHSRVDRASIARRSRGGVAGYPDRALGKNFDRISVTIDNYRDPG
jgi:hypothetical protein